MCCNSTPPSVFLLLLLLLSYTLFGSDRWRNLITSLLALFSYLQVVYIFYNFLFDLSFRLLHLQLFRAVFVNWHSNSGLTDGNWELPGWAMYKRGAVGQGSENMPCFCSSLSPFRLALLRKRAQPCISVVVRLKRCVEVDFRSLTSMCVQSCAWMCLWETFLCWHYGDCSTAALC